MELIALILGILAGTVTGITPGLHVNLVSSIAASSQDLLSPWFSSMDIIIFIVAMATAHTLLDVVPSIFLGAPSDSYAVAVLPGHRLLRQGAGYEAVRLATAGSLICAITSISLSPALWFLVPPLTRVLSPVMAYLLIGVMALLILRENRWQEKRNACLTAFLSGLLGYLVLRTMPLEDPLLPLLSGLFGASGLILSFGEEPSLAPQFITESLSIPARRAVLLTLAAVFSGWIVSLLPGVGAAQAAVVSLAILPRLMPGEYLYLVGGIGTVNFILSIITAATIQKARNGAIAQVLHLASHITPSQAMLLLFAALAAAGMAALATLSIARLCVSVISRISYPLLCLTVLIAVSALIAWRSGPAGMLVFITSTALGIWCNTLGIARSHLMASLMVPAITYYL